MAVRLAVRPEHVALARGSGGAGLRGRVSQCVFNGASTAVLIEFPDGSVLRATVGANTTIAGLQPGTEVTAHWPPDHATVFPADRS